MIIALFVLLFVAIIAVCYVGSVIALICMANETLPRVAKQNRIPTLTGTLIVIFVWPAVLIGAINEIKRRF